MGKFLIGLIAIILFGGGIAAFAYYQNGFTFSPSIGVSVGKTTIAFESQEIGNGKIIPVSFSCDGDNVSPPLTIDRVPGDAKSLVIIMDDADSNPKNFTHWILYNIDPERLNIETGKTPEEADAGRNDFGEVGYSGPCPAQGQTHKYYFKIYALKTKLNLSGNPGRAEIDKAIIGNVVATGQFYGEYLNRFFTR